MTSTNTLKLVPPVAMRIFGTLIVCFALAFASLPVLVYALRGTAPIGASAPEPLLLVFLAAWMLIPLVCGLLIWRYYVSPVVLSSPIQGHLITAGHFLFVPWKRVWRDVDRAWIIHRRVYRKHGSDICDVILIRSGRRKSHLADGVLLTDSQIQAAADWLTKIAGVPVRDLRPRVVG